MRTGLICALVLWAAPAVAQASPSPDETAAPRGLQPIASVLARKAQRSLAQRKLDSRLLEVAPVPAWVTVDIRADVTPDLLVRIDELGGTVISSVPKYRAVRARLPGAAVELLAELPEVQFIRTGDRAFTHQEEIVETWDWVETGDWVETSDWVERSSGSVVAGPVRSEGDAAHRADAARDRFRVDGTGIGIGVISDGVDSLAQRQAEGDLPERVTVLPGQAGAGDEGTAMLEIVHDLAPGAELYFATGFDVGEAQFAANIEALCEAGASVIVDGLAYFLEAAFQDGIVAQGINAAAAEGCVHFSSAGNRGNLNDETSGTWEGDYTAGRPVDADGEDLGTAHDFGDGVEANPLLENGFAFVLQWSDPLGASANDYDLFLLDSADNVLRSSTNLQDGSQDPIEFIDSTGVNAGDARLLVVKASGEDRYLRLDTLRGRLEVATEGATVGHNAAERAFGVAAVDVRSAGGTGGVFDGSESVEVFSADGPRRIFYEPDGTAITPGDLSSTGGRLLQKPDLAAADQVSTGTPGFSRFAGTSAAAPHAAAIAALMLEAAGGPADLALPELRYAMARSALDIEAPGVDRDSGAGILMAFDAVAAVAEPEGRRNRAPAARGELPQQSLLLNDDAVTLSIADAFQDPDGDRLDYSLFSTDPVRVDAELTGTDVTLTPLGPGRLSVLVRASDPDGLSAVQVIRIEIRAGDRDYDTDDDALIEVGTLAQLDAIRYDLDADGFVDGEEWRPYYEAFPEGALEMGCPAGCEGYELTADLDFDTDGSGSADEGDAYWNDGAGWAPIGEFFGTSWIHNEGVAYTATFDGNGHEIANLHIDRADENGVGLFGFIGAYGASGGHEIRDVALPDIQIRGHDFVGGLLGVGLNRAVWRAYATGSVSGNNGVGGLAGRAGYLVHTFATATVSATGNGAGGLAGVANAISASYATGRVSGFYAVGGLVGFLDGGLEASYATGRVSGQGDRVSVAACGLIGGVGGLVGHACGDVSASYATGPASGVHSVGGLVGSFLPGKRGFRSFWDVETSGVRVGVGSDDTDDSGAIDGDDLQTSGVVALSTAGLQGATGYEGVFATWNLGLPGGGDLERVNAWNMGNGTQYPALVADLDGDGSATWEEFGYQVRSVPVLEAVSPTGEARVELDWAGVDTGVWNPEPGTTYRVTREDGDGVETIADDLDGLVYTDNAVTVDTVYAYQVAALVLGGEPVRSARVRVKAGTANALPVAVGVPEDRSVRLTETATIDVSDAFRDPDGDSLTVEAVSSAPDILTVSVSGSRVTLTPAGVGVAIVTVSARDTDGSGEAAVLHIRVAVWPATAVDYDSDDDGLIEIGTLQQLDAMRQDLDGDGVVDRGDLFTGPSDALAYSEAFPDAVERMGCIVLEGCNGYELVADLDFDTNSSGAADAGDAFWNDGAGWTPIGGRDSISGPGYFVFGNPFRTTFEGNGHSIANLFVDTDHLVVAGLFGVVSVGVIRNLGIVDAALAGQTNVGALVGYNGGRLMGNYASGRVSARDGLAGGLVGLNRWAVSASYATASVSVQSGGRGRAGGLVGYNGGTVTAGYATGAVAGRSSAGALVGFNASRGTIVASYATGPVLETTGEIKPGGGLVGSGTGTVVDSYSERLPSSETRATHGRTRAELQAPTRYRGIFSDWNLDLDGDGAADDPWRFGTSAQYPALAVDTDGDGRTRGRSSDTNCGPGRP